MSSFSDKIKTSAAEWDDKTKDVGTCRDISRDDRDYTCLVLTSQILAEWLKMASKSTGLSRAAILAIIAVVIALVAFFGIGAGFFWWVCSSCRDIRNALSDRCAIQLVELQQRGRFHLPCLRFLQSNRVA